MKRKVIFSITLGLSASIFSCGPDDIIDNLKELINIYKKVANGENLKAYIVKDEEYYLFNSEQDIIYLGKFNNETLDFEEVNNTYGFILPSSGQLDLNPDLVTDTSKLLINKNTSETYSYINDIKLSKTFNSMNSDKLYYYNDYEEGYEIEPILNKYNQINNESIKNYYINNLLAFNKINNLNEFSNLYKDINVNSDYNAKKVISVGDFSSFLKGVNLNNISLKLNNDIENIGKGAFDGINIDNDIFYFPKSLKHIDELAFNNSKINTLYVYDNKIEISENSFDKTYVNTLNFESNLTLNKELINYLNTTNQDLNIKYGKNSSLNYYDTLANALENERIVNPLLDLKNIEENNVITNDNLTSIDEEKVLILSTKKVKDDGTNYIGSDVREYGNLSQSEANNIADMFSESFIKEKTKNVYTLKLTNDLVIKGKVYIGAVINTQGQRNQGYITGDYITIDLNGHNIEILDGGLIESSGYIIDSSKEHNGQINVRKGGILSTNFVIEDFSGGSISAARYFNNETPFDLYRMCYLEAKTNVYYGGKLNALCVLYASGKQNETVQTIVGTNGLFELVEEGYITKDVNYIDNKYDGIDYIKVFGSCKTNAMTLKTSMEIKTDEVFFPVTRNQNISIYQGTFIMNTKMKVLPGAVINVYGGSEVVINENVIIYEEYKTQDEVKELASLSGINFSIYRDYYVSSNYTKETIPQAQVNFYKDSKLKINEAFGINGLVNTEDETIFETLSTMYKNTNFNNALVSSEGYGKSIFSYVLLYNVSVNNITKLYKDLSDDNSLLKVMKEVNHEVTIS